jgi:hypothetical protein
MVLDMVLVEVTATKLETRAVGLFTTQFSLIQVSSPTRRSVRTATNL